VCVLEHVFVGFVCVVSLLVVSVLCVSFWRVGWESCVVLSVFPVCFPLLLQPSIFPSIRVSSRVE